MVEIPCFRLRVFKCFIESKGIANNVNRELERPLLRTRYVRSVFGNLGSHSYLVLQFLVLVIDRARVDRGWEMWYGYEKLGK